jgi:hypothetical protein
VLPAGSTQPACQYISALYSPCQIMTAILTIIGKKNEGKVSREDRGRSSRGRDCWSGGRRRYRCRNRCRCGSQL